MKIDVTEDKTTRVIQFEIADGPDLCDETAHWRDKPRMFRAQTGRLVLDGDRFVSITVTGHLVLKGGRLSETLKDSMTWQPDSGYRGKISQAPDWVRFVASEAPQGVQGWSYPDGEATAP